MEKTTRKRYYINKDHVDFVACTKEQLKEGNRPYIHIYSRKFNKKIYKKKKRHIGWIIKINSKEWCFLPNEELKATISYVTMKIITDFINNLNFKRIEYNFKTEKWSINGEQKNDK